MKKNISIAIVIMTALITGCGNNEQTATPTVFEDQVVETIDDTESVDDTKPVEVEIVPETPVVTGRVNRDDYWEGDTFHLDEYAAALGYNHREGLNTCPFIFKYTDSYGKYINDVLIWSPWGEWEIKCDDDLNHFYKEFMYNVYHDDGDRRIVYSEIDGEIYEEGEYAYFNTIIDTFDYFAYEASDAFDLDGLPYCWMLDLEYEIPQT